MEIFAGKKSKKLAEKIAKILNKKLGKKELIKFPDGEIKIRLRKDVKGKDVFLIQSTHPPLDNLWELVLMINAAKENKARKIFVILPYFGYARQNRIFQKGESISAKIIAKLLEIAGADKIFVIDIHSSLVFKFFKIPVISLSALPLFEKKIKELIKKDFKKLIVLAPDKGAIPLAKKLKKRLKCKIVLCKKKRLNIKKVKISFYKGVKLENKIVIIVDDIIATGNTIKEAVREAKRAGAKEIYAFCTHGVFSSNFQEKIKKIPIKKLFITDTIPQKKDEKIEIISISPLIANAILKEK